MDSPFSSKPIGGAVAEYPEMDMEVHCVIGDGPSIWIFHDKPFSKILSWIEYDLTTSRLDFVLEDGDIRNFGIPIDRMFGAHMQNVHTIPVVLRNNDDMLAGDNYPLIVHRA
jgi:hypothetical protein